ncbi:MAG: type 1 glutamine amidotransferase [Deltaproteobacteria bacterium]|nr:type 1 glutamine amidotransferase [Deltaproteobacteria bacterium]
MTKKIAVLLASDFEDSEFEEPVKALREAGHRVVVIGRDKGETLEGKRGDVRAETDQSIADVDAADFDALLIPGGYSPDQLRTDDRMVSFVRAFADTSKPLAAICHGPQLLIEAGVVADKKLTSWPSVRTDLRNAGATVIDDEVVVDGPLITSRKPDDIPAFNAALLSQL